MKIYTLEQEQLLPISLKVAWDFFSDPANLQRITPPFMGFVVHTNLNGRRTYAGMMIEYTVRPLFGLPMKWLTEITHVREPFYFVDEQRIGPYALWHHEHFFEEREGGVYMRDLVHYALPMGVLGRMAHPLLVGPKLKQVFDFRAKALDEIFGKMPQL